MAQFSSSNIVADGVHSIICEHGEWDEDTVVRHLLEGTWDRFQVTFVLILHCLRCIEHRANLRKVDVVWLRYILGGARYLDSSMHANQSFSSTGQGRIEKGKTWKSYGVVKLGWKC